ncbi:MAG: FxsA family protein [Alphaproteobacteria bacterium]
MPLVLLLIVVGLPIVELFVLIEIGGRIGGLYTIALVLLTAACGLFVVRLQGTSVLARAQSSLAENRVPVGEIVDGLFLLLAGGFLLFPGFITDAFGLLLLIPGLRRIIGLGLWRGLQARGSVRSWASGRDGDVDIEIVEGEYEEINDEPEDGEENAGAKTPRLTKPSGESSPGKNAKPRR